MNTTRAALLTGLAMMFWAPVLLAILVTATSGPWWALLLSTVVFVTAGLLMVRRNRGS